jgi:hypothetical protein
MFKEWLLIAWLGTSTNFTVLSHHPSSIQCQEAQAQVTKVQGIVYECRQDLREGRSQLQRRSGQYGLIKK